MLSSMTQLYTPILAKALQTALLVGFLCFSMSIDANAQHVQLKTGDLFIKAKQTTAFTSGAHGDIKGATHVQNDPVVSSHNNNSLPQHLAYYEHRGIDWELVYNNTLTYTATGQVKSEIFRDSTGENTKRHSHNYDSQGNITEFLIDEWLNNEWVLDYGRRNQFTYNTAGFITELFSQSFGEGAWKNSYKLIYTYDDANRVTEAVYYDWNSSDWQTDYRLIYAYASTNALPDTVVIQEWENNAYVNNDRFIDIVWNNAEELESFISQEWINNAWENVLKSNSTYDALGGRVTILQEWVNNTWLNEFRDSITNDEHGNEVAKKTEHWTNNAWVFSSESQYNLTYSETGDLTERIRRYWRDDEEGWVNSYREVYSNFLRVTTSLPVAIAKMTVHVYPNPVTDVLHLNTDVTESTLLQLTDITGKVVYTKTLLARSAAVQEINLSALPAGMYVLSLRNNKTSHTSKILKQ
jgi:hypothetical protein